MTEDGFTLVTDNNNDVPMEFERINPKKQKTYSKLYRF